MHKRKKFLFQLIIALFAVICLSLLIATFSPEDPIELGSVALSPIIPFLLLIFTFTSGLISFILASTRRGILGGLLTTTLITLQYLHVNTIFYTVIVCVIFVLIELLFWKKK